MDSLLVFSSALGAVAILLTAKVQNLLKPKGKLLNYLVAFGVSTGLVLAAKFLDAGALGLPDISGLSWGDLAVVDALVFAMAGGFWDILKIVGIRKPK